MASKIKHLLTEHGPWKRSRSPSPQPPSLRHPSTDDLQATSGHLVHSPNNNNPTSLTPHRAASPPIVTSSEQVAITIKVDDETTAVHRSVSPSELNKSKTAENTENSSADASAWPWLTGFLEVTNKAAGVFGPLKDVAELLLDSVGIYEEAAKGKVEYDELRRELRALLTDIVNSYRLDRPSPITTSVECLCISIQQELKFVQGKQMRPTYRRYIEAKQDAQSVFSCYRRIYGYLQRLLLNANLSVVTTVTEEVMNNRLDRLNPALTACYNSAKASSLNREACTQDTRVAVLETMFSWAYLPSRSPVYWLNGMAGTGKTTIAYSLCMEFDRTRNLGASFFCSRLLPECRDVNSIIPTIAYQLAEFSFPFRHALSQILQLNRNVHQRLLEVQFDKLIASPLRQVRGALPNDLIVVIDALDECEDSNSTKKILEILLEKTSDLPIKFFVSSRPEPEIRGQLEKQTGELAPLRIILHQLDQGTVEEDVKKYLRTALNKANIAESQITTLAKRSGYLFIYAATVVRYISDEDFSRSSDRLEAVMDSSNLIGSTVDSDIDKLYTVILKAALENPKLDPRDKNEIKRVLSAVICAREPLTISALAHLLRLDEGPVWTALRRLWSVLHITDSSANAHVTTLHASFTDFMFDEKRSGDCYCDPAVQHLALTQDCFRCIMTAHPQFNICKLESSFVRDEELEAGGLPQRIEQAISLELYYACQYWGSHLVSSSEPTALASELRGLLSLRFLLWMEVMNLKKAIHSGARMMQTVEACTMRHSFPDDVVELAHDAWRFVTTFASSPVSESTPHIYVSMLPFWPTTSPISECYSRRFPDTIRPEGPALARRQSALLARWPFEGPVTSAAFSPDGLSIALSVETSIYTVNAITGQILFGPLEGHTGWITSVQFSPDGARIVSGSHDSTVWLWNAENGQPIFRGLKGHTKHITSIAFSPDNQTIATGSRDRNIGIWDTLKLGAGSQCRFLKGSGGSVESIAFSSDGTLLVSGSDDYCIYLWNVETGELLFDQLKGHTHVVTSVRFSLSADDTRIISGSHDKTIRLWDVKTGKMIQTLFEGLPEPITSVGFSHDGSRIVWGSRGRDINIWDINNKKLLLGPLQGHTDWVTFAGFSPDGTQVLSGSHDATICLWDARSKQVDTAPLDGHSRGITTVKFSTDLKQIVSCSLDQTIRLWDAQSGTMLRSLGLGDVLGFTITSMDLSMGGTHIVFGSSEGQIRVWDVRGNEVKSISLHGHTSEVRLVAYSPDSRFIVSTSLDETILLWDAECAAQNALATLQGHTDWVTAVKFSPDSTRIVSGSDDATIRVWSAEKKQLIQGPLEGHTSRITAVIYSPKGDLIVSGSLDNTIRFWDSQTGELVQVPIEAHAITSIDFSPEGSYILVGSHDNTIRMWDTTNRDMVFGPLRGHTDWVTSVGFSSSGSYIVSGSRDNTIRVWDIGKTGSGSFIGKSPLNVYSWTLDKDGWIVQGFNLLAWVPPDLRHTLMWPNTILQISSDGYVRITFSGAKMGDKWFDCHTLVTN